MTRSDMPSDPAATVRSFRVCRDAMIEVQRCVQPMGPIHHAASMVTSAIDAFATLLRGQRYYFFIDGSTASDARLERDTEQTAQERGEKPWRP